MKVAICDDDGRDRSRLAALLRQYAVEQSFEFELCEFCDGAALLEAIRTYPDIDIAFLDIYMGEVTGLEAAKAIRAARENCAIVFTTVSADHYAESYEVGAEHYLLKPVSGERVAQAMARCQCQLRAAARYAEFACHGTTTRLLLREVRYIEVLKNVSILHAPNTLRLVSTLEAVLERLDDRFVRCHRSYVVNLDWVERIGNTQMLLRDGAAVPLGRTFAAGTRQALARRMTQRATGVSQ